MADFWIKIEKSTPDKPEIFEIAELLGIDPDAVLGKLIRVWSWLDSNSENGHIKSVTPVLIDRLTSHKGFANAMREAGWLANDAVPNFDRHLGLSAKKRAKDAERKRLSRTKSQDCHNKGVTQGVTETGLDKSRVDKSRYKYKYSYEHLKIAEFIFNRVKEVMPKTKNPNIEAWANVIRLMHENDKIELSDICSVFDWANKDPFWTTNILSPSKLRDKYPSLSAKAVLSERYGKSNALPQYGVEDVLLDTSWAPSDDDEGDDEGDD